MQSLPRFDGMAKEENFGDLIKAEHFGDPIKEEKIAARDGSNMHRARTSVPQPAQRGRPSTKHPQIPGICKAWKCARAECPKSFSRKSDLNRHDNIHTNTRSHKCDHIGCGKSFIQTSALTVHRRIHTGEKPHVCEICSRPFSDSSSLARHRRTHENKIVPCSFATCNKRFADEAGLQKHVSREHPSELQNRAGEHGRGSRDAERLGQKADVNSIVSKDADVMRQRSCVKTEEDVKMEDMDSSTTPFGLRLASHASLPTADEVYYPSQSPLSDLRTGTAGTWHLGNTQQYPSRACTPRAQRPHLPLVIPAADGIYDVAPMSAPISYGHSDMASHPFPYMTSVMSQDYAQAYSNNPSAASSPMAQHMQMPTYHMVLSYRQRPSPMYRQRSHHNVENFGPVPTPLQPTRNADTDMYSSPVESNYREPQDMGIINDTHHYQLPGTAFDMPDDDKMIDEFGEPLPSQLF